LFDDLLISIIGQTRYWSIMGKLFN